VRSWHARPSTPNHSILVICCFTGASTLCFVFHRVQRVVREIMACPPFTTILASATMPASWDLLPKWWKGRQSAVRATITSVRALFISHFYSTRRVSCSRRGVRECSARHHHLVACPCVFSTLIIRSVCLKECSARHHHLGVCSCLLSTPVACGEKVVKTQCASPSPRYPCY